MRCLALLICLTIVADTARADDVEPASLLFTSDFNSSTDYLGAAAQWKTSWPLGSGITSAATPGEVEIYVDVRKGETIGPNPFSVANSILTITARPTEKLPKPFTYTSGCLSTAGSFSYQYGYAEIRCKAPKGKGFWPTFWLMKWTRDWHNVAWPPEIDVFQYSSRLPKQYYPAVLSGTKQKTIEAGQFIDTKADLSEAMHVYGFDWTAKQMTWYVDDKVVMQKPSPPDTNVRMYLMLSLAVGDDSGWIGPPDGSTAKWEIDYVKVWDRKP